LNTTREHPNAPERLGQLDLLARRRIEPEVITKLHAQDRTIWFMSGHGDIRTGRHCVFLLHAHLVFVTKFRHRVFTSPHLARLEEIMRQVCADFETELAEFNGEHNHVHLLVNFPPKVTPSRLVNSLKGVSSRRIRTEFPELAQHFYQTNKLWSGSYFAGSIGGAPLSTVHHYIEQQNQPTQHRRSLEA
jgi:putative transposase